jgi:NDP-sugar pyrophosphorylase family protein
MHILIPMSGRGSRFAQQGYTKPKPLIEFFGKSMVQHVLENLGVHNTYTLCVLREHYDADPALFARLRDMVSDLNIVFVDQITQGAAETCLLAREYIKPRDTLFIANCDQIMHWDQDHFEEWLAAERLDGAMLTFFKDTTAYSYVEVDENRLAVRTAEKQVISPHATTGIYVWTRGEDFIWAAEQMIADDVRVNGEFYVCPVYNWNIARGDRIGIYDTLDHWPIGTPEDLDIYIEAHS